ncbi:hypothetical protein PIB30_079577 [Stylosanthes scabra]|uniref:Uncharacterized protein n=1 Tax=Stylosanthes scabra TaxID=79078 RepID=A0ABU6ZPT7_9FABA|nr:hypothetical protein [Stylosanthes scabra]
MKHVPPLITTRDTLGNTQDLESIGAHEQSNPSPSLPTTTATMPPLTLLPPPLTLLPPRLLFLARLQKVHVVLCSGVHETRFKTCGNEDHRSYVDQVEGREDAEQKRCSQ